MLTIGRYSDVSDPTKGKSTDNTTARRFVLPSKERNRILKEIHQGSIESLKVILQNEISFHWSDIICYQTTGDTLLHIAAKLGYTQIVHYLLCQCQPVIVDCRNKQNKTALHEAVQFSRYEIVRLLIKMGADVNAIKRGDWTPLMLACANVMKDMPCDIVRLLLNEGALTNCKNKDGWTALHLAARVGNVDVVKRVLSSHADKTLTTKNGSTPLHVAVLHGNLEVVDTLLTSDVHVEYLEMKDMSGNTALHIALLGQNLDVCRLLIQKGADVTCRNSSDFNLLHVAATVDDVAVVGYVLNELKFDVNCVNRNGWGALHCAAKKNVKPVYDYLIEHGAASDLTDNYGRRPCDYLKF